MNGQRSSEYLEGLLHELRALPRETEWLEFKESYAEPQDIGEYISALANSAALAGKAAAYLVWGIRDSDHAVVGTTFEPQAARKGNEELESWLLRLLEPKIDFHFFRMETEAGPVVLTEIARAIRHPVRFAGREYIRVGSYKKNLKDYPEKEGVLWRIFDRTPFEDGVAFERDAEDKLVLQVELFQLPAPLFEQPGDATRATLFAHKSLKEMGRQERIRSCYFHACLNHVLGKPVTNSSIRQRFGIPGHNASTASRLLGEAVDAGVIAVESNGGTRSRRYVPFWAAQASESPIV